MYMSQRIAIILTATMLTTGCTQPMGRAGDGMTQGGSSINKQDIGLIGGAIGGGIIGSNVGKGKGAIAGTIAGTLLGAAIGSSIGSSLDRADLAAYNDTSQRALESGQPGQTLPWKNARTGNYGSVTPSNYYQNSQGQYCREYTQTIVVGGRKEEGFGRACRQPDGSWQIIE